MAAQSIAHSSLAVCPLILGLAAAALQHRRFSERGAARTLVLALFLGSLVALLFELDRTRAFAPSRRWDAPIYCAAREAYDAGLSPYLVSNLKRFQEARDEAQALVAKYPGYRFARDAERDLLVHP